MVQNLSVAVDALAQLEQIKDYVHKCMGVALFFHSGAASLVWTGMASVVWTWPSGSELSSWSLCIEERTFNFRCLGCDRRENWIFYPGFWKWKDEFCPYCSSFIFFLLYRGREKNWERAYIRERSFKFRGCGGIWHTHCA